MSTTVCASASCRRPALLMPTRSTLVEADGVHAERAQAGPAGPAQVLRAGVLDEGLLIGAQVASLAHHHDVVRVTAPRGKRPCDQGLAASRISPNPIGAN
jgi:hypothetical protein